MSRHEIETEYHTWVVGWDNPLMSFFLQRYDKGDTKGNVADIWLGGSSPTQMHEIEDLVVAAAERGLVISYEIQADLWEDKAIGR